MSGPTRLILLGIVILSGCAHPPRARFTLYKGPEISLELKGSRKKRLFGVRLPCKLTLGELVFKSRPLLVIPLSLELRSGAGMRKSGLHGFHLGGRLSLTGRIAGCLVLAVNYSTLLAFQWPDDSRIGFVVGGSARLDL